MLKVHTPQPGFLFFSIIYNQDKTSIDELTQLIESKWGQGELFHPSYNPSLEYYSKEMGDDTLLKRVFVIIHQLFSRENLVEAKQWALKGEFPNGDKPRSINLDPGFLGLEQILLATSKPYSHRIYLNHGVWVELCLVREAKFWKPVYWTYPDYQDQLKIQWFEIQRNHLKKHLGKIS